MVTNNIEIDIKDKCVEEQMTHTYANFLQFVEQRKAKHADGYYDSTVNLDMSAQYNMFEKRAEINVYTALQDRMTIG